MYTLGPTLFKLRHSIRCLSAYGKRRGSQRRHHKSIYISVQVARNYIAGVKESVKKTADEKMSQAKVTNALFINRALILCPGVALLLRRGFDEESASPETSVLSNLD